MSTDLDILIGFTCSVTIYDKNFSYLNAKIIELNWLNLNYCYKYENYRCAYDLKLKKLIEEV